MTKTHTRILTITLVGVIANAVFSRVFSEPSEESLKQAATEARQTMASEWERQQKFIAEKKELTLKYQLLALEPGADPQKVHTTYKHEWNKLMAAHGEPLVE